jgi:hypothetical protein
MIGMKLGEIATPRPAGFAMTEAPSAGLAERLSLGI